MKEIPLETKVFYSINYLLGFLDIPKFYAAMTPLDFLNLVTAYYKKEDEKVCSHLQDLIGRYLFKEFNWITPLSLIESMEFVVNESIKNGNIK